ncbi:MAG: phosphoribosylformylglycinamidine cyclo-ligase [Deltaproteobacteria bacterium]|nr:phosphoribosylformylglycinamidine cyclo-ligase [Deltaproteobacteria bacterium]MBW2333783.1 phosphoribosylformylglycinamidine cyclo-ligase [Deltaproteobacteria bacterium]
MTYNKRKDSYADAGVDIDAGKNFVEIIKPIVSKTFKSNVLSDIGGYAGLYSLSLGNIKKPILVSSTDGVGTKLKIAFMLNKHDTIGIDLVAMCVNDILVQGATPLFFLDYLSMGKLDRDTAVEIIKGITKGCKEAKCALIGGETAEMPGFYAKEEYDLAGFAIGLVDNDQIIDGSEIALGHRLIGIGSSGLHSNGYSLVRKIFFDTLKMSVNDYVDEFGRTVGEELLEPTTIYAKTLNPLIKNFHIYGISHITGGGITENLPRILPTNCKAVIRQLSWTPQPIFHFIKKAGNLTEEEMIRTFNNGIGLILIVAEKDVQDIMQQIQAMGEKAYQIGWIEERKRKDSALKFID